MTIPFVGERALPHQIGGHITDVPSEVFEGQHCVLDWDASVAMHGHRQAEPEIVEYLGQQNFTGLSVATNNIFLRQARGLEDWQPTIYRPRFITNPNNGRIKFVIKAHVSFYLDLATQEEIDPTQITVFDNSYSLGAAAASQAGCRVILLDPLKSTSRPEYTRVGHKLDRWRLQTVQNQQQQLTAA